jgi:hypothetical protein
MIRPDDRGRDPLSAVWTAIVFGAVLSPYWLIAFGVLDRFAPAFGLIAIPALMASTLVLSGILVRESAAEAALRKRFSRVFPALMILLAGLCLFVNLALLVVMTNFTLLTAAEYRFWLSAIVCASSALAIVPVMLLPASRLERILSARLASGGGHRSGYRLCAYLLLVTAAAVCCWAGYGYYAALPPPPG